MSKPQLQIDPRGQRFTAVINLLGFGAALAVAPSVLSNLVLLVLGVAFAIGTLRGPHLTPWALVFRSVIRPRLGAPRALEDAAPPRFAQAVGLIFTAAGLLGYLTGATLLGAIAVGFALAAAFLNAVFGFCLGCEVYLLARRLAPSSKQPASHLTKRPVQPANN